MIKSKNQEATVRNIVFYVYNDWMMKYFSSVRRQVRGDRMRSGIDKTIREFKNILLVRGMDIRMEGERLKADYYYYSLLPYSYLQY